MKPGLSLRVSQHLTLTPQLQQSIRLLQLSTLELDQEVEHMLVDNPFLDREDADIPQDSHGLPQADAPVSVGDRISEQASSTGERESASSGDEEYGSTAADSDYDLSENWEGDGNHPMSADDGEWGGEAPPRGAGAEDDTQDASERTGVHESLYDVLHRQALALHLSDVDQAAVYFIIESLNEDGYLEESLDDLADGLRPTHIEQREELFERLSIALRLVQAMEPTGVGARDLGECMRLQLNAMLQARPDDAIATVALDLAAQPLDLIARRDARKLSQLCGFSETTVRTGLACISRLEPKPGRRFVDVERHIVVPDVLVSRIDEGNSANPRFRVRLNQDVMPKLRVNDVYANALRGGKGDSHQALQQRLQEARWFIKNIQQRFDTILRVSNAIVERQRSFFIHGALAMQPLVLREIADELGLHESTISRVTTAKYMATPFGTFELKYFFGSGLDTEAGGSASSTAVRALIKQFIGEENPKKPLSDNQISEMLKEQGIDCARRTVAKYREGMRIPTTTLRRAL
jgi:RNA polymerase sigma-54 factor